MTTAVLVDVVDGLLHVVHHLHGTLHPPVLHRHGGRCGGSELEVRQHDGPGVDTDLVGKRK